MSDNPIYDKMNEEPTPEFDKVINASSADNRTYPAKHVQGEITPNVVITNSDTRRILGIGLYILAFLSGIAALFLGFFPEFNDANQVFVRSIAFTNALISLTAGTFGIVVTTPNVPKANG